MSSPKFSERGQALIVIIFTLLGLFGVVGLAIDGGNIYVDRIRAQNAADTTALQAALARINGQRDWVTAAYQKAADGGYSNDGGRSIVQISSPPINGRYKGNIEYIQVTITSNVKTYLAGVIGVTQLTNRVEAISRSKPSVWEPMMNGAAVVSLATSSDCNKHRAFTVRGSATLSIIDSGIFVNSGNSKCALTTQADGSIRLQGDGDITVVGGASIQKPRLLTPYPPNTGVLPVSYPPPFFLPKVSCSKEAEVSKDGLSMSAGSWGDEFPPPGVKTLGNGVYCISGDFILKGEQELDGSGVVIKIEHGRVQFARSSKFTLRAPTSGKLAGLLLFLPPENKSKVQLNGGDDSILTGAVLATAAEVHINGNDNHNGWKTQIIGYTVDITGESNIVIRYVDELIYDALSMPQVQFIK